MEAIVNFVESHITWAPYISCLSMVLAGFNIPISEDVMVITNAILAVKFPEMAIPLFLGVHIGAFLGDIVSYFIGKLLGIKIWSIKFFKKALKKDHFTKMEGYFKKYGLLTLVVGRFIPFGVRNAIFLSAGVSGYSFKKFWYKDWVACFISNITLFLLTVKFGENIYNLLSIYRIPAFIAFIVILLFFAVKSFLKKRKLPVGEETENREVV